MRWKITIEGMDEFSGHDTAEMVIEKEFNRLWLWCTDIGVAAF